jgi:hypothetical protein
LQSVRAVQYFYDNEAHGTAVYQLGHVAKMGQRRNTYEFFLEKFHGRRLLERSKWRWEIIVQWISKDVGFESEW